MSIKCPICREGELILKYEIKKVPIVGEELFLIVECNKCGYKVVDSFPLYYKQKKKIILEVESEEDLGILIYRYKYATIRIPELGLEVYPGSEPNDYITTVEGILNRFLDILQMAKSFNKDEKDKLKKIEEIEKEINLVKEGKKKITIEIEDPDGLSKVFSEKAKEIEIQ